MRRAGMSWRGVARTPPGLRGGRPPCVRFVASPRQATIDGGTVAWPGDLDVAIETVYALAHGLPRPGTFEAALANELEVSLRELRSIANVTQAEAAEAMGINQGQLSRFEHQDDRKLSTLRKYVEALGGELEVVAVLGSKRLTLRGI